MNKGMEIIMEHKIFHTKTSVFTAPEAHTAYMQPSFSYTFKKAHNVCMLTSLSSTHVKKQYNEDNPIIMGKIRISYYC